MELERVTINLVPDASDALARACETDRLNKTDVINRALQLYGYVRGVQHDGDDLCLRKSDGSLVLLKLL